MRNWRFKEVIFSLLVNFPFLVHPRSWKIPGSYRYVGTDTCRREGNAEVWFRKNEYENEMEISKNDIWLKNINIEKKWEEKE